MKAFKYLSFLLMTVSTFAFGHCLESIKEVADVNGLKMKVNGFRVVIVDEQLSGAIEAAREFLMGQPIRTATVLCPYVVGVIASPGVTRGIFEELGANFLTTYETGGAGAAISTHIPIPQVFP